MFYVVSCHSIIAQQPAYFLMGEAHFRGVQIYDITQDNDLNYWFATNEGIYYYDFVSYKKIECKESRGISIFNFVKDPEGTIFCHNLNNQIFRIKDKKCTLLYELLEDERYNDIGLIVSSDGNLIISATKLIVLNANGTVLQKEDFFSSNLSSPYLTTDNSIIYHVFNSETIIVYKDGIFIKKNFKGFVPDKMEDYLFNFFTLNEKLFAVELMSKNLFLFNLQSMEMQALPDNDLFNISASIRIYGVEKKAWIAGTLSGISLINHPADNPVRFFQDYFISDVFKDAEGNYLLSTFDKGIIVIPDISVPDVIGRFENDLITSIKGIPKMGVFLGSSKGNLINYYLDKLVVVSSSGSRPIEGVFSNTTSPLVFFDDGNIKSYNLITRDVYTIYKSSLKDVAFVSDSLFYLGTNSGVLEARWKGDNSFDYHWLDEFKTRVYSLEYNTVTAELYVATSEGLFLLDAAKTKTKIKIKGKEIFSNYLTCNNGSMYSCDNENGIVALKGSKVVSNYNPFGEHNMEVLKKIMLHNGFVYAKSNSGFYKIDLTNKSSQPLNTLYGLLTKRVIDFTFFDNQLWVTHTGGVQKINVEYKNVDVSLPQVKINKLEVNNAFSTLINNRTFSSNERKFQFTLASPTIKNQFNLKYHYLLKGYDSEWNSVSFDKNDVVYNALSPGAYTFIVKTEINDVFSEPVSYSFTIQAPFYMRWWFITLTIFIFLVVIFLVYRRQLKAQQKKSDFINELNASKLTAIQSQMNPHFIFNSLNSIQDLVLKGDVDNSYTFITKFSNLVRQTLSYSDKDFIEFDQELILIELYLSLEKLRFKENLKIEINADGIEGVFVPPMLIQPFIENALLHGLLHKEGVKKLNIQFTLNDTLICEITDNGIGRVKSKEIKQRQRNMHESFSTKAIKSRFEILERHYGGTLGFSYQDLYENNAAVGTKVILIIPIKREF